MYRILYRFLASLARLTVQAVEAQVVPECVGAGSTATSLRICHTMEAAKQLASE